MSKEGVSCTVFRDSLKEIWEPEVEKMMEGQSGLVSNGSDGVLYTFQTL